MSEGNKLRGELILLVMFYCLLASIFRELHYLFGFQVLMILSDVNMGMALSSFIFSRLLFHSPLMHLEEKNQHLIEENQRLAHENQVLQEYCQLKKISRIN